ncbi:TetR family transcriptional regulator [Bordetella ansorpii]|uniref:TetR family transcriptional regulator n=1 Tax=Bordetella ansorpii TaxID=288768 RepID=A0A157KJ97_9BORD|nr:TetR/AcrR family transcriptional regulator [Bordetella ansorpii]SAH84440.1 TetR family transcriptional regulator [Bordetella ansorpii]
MSLPAPPPAARANAKAAKILEAARDVFLQHGFAEATSDMIQQAAGVSKATMYAHFENKEALFIAAIEHQCGEVVAEMRKTEFATGPIQTMLTEIGRTYLLQALSPRGLATVRVVVAAAPRFPALARTFFVLGPRTVCELVARHLALAIERGDIDLGTVGLDVAANHFLSLIRGEAQLECLLHPDSRPSEAQIESWTTSGVETFLRAYGVAHQKSGARAGRKTARA